MTGKLWSSKVTWKLWSSKVTGKLWNEHRARPAKPVTCRIAGSAKYGARSNPQLILYEELRMRRAWRFWTVIKGRKKMDDLISESAKRQLRKEIPALKAEILALYRSLDRKFGLHAAEVPIEFGFDEERLGAYTSSGNGQEESFYFSLVFVGFLSRDSLHREDKLDLYKHEYAHYMQFHMDIPKEYRFRKYCCSLVGAAPSEYYRFGKGREKHDYEKALNNPWKNPHTALLDLAHRKREAEDSRNRTIRYRKGDIVVHPKFGPGTIEDLEQMTGSVRLTIRFPDAVRKIDQKWLLRSNYKKRS